MKKIIGVLIFFSGVGTGILGSYYFIKKHLEKAMNDDFQERRTARIEENNKNNINLPVDVLEKSNENRNKPDLTSYVSSLSNYASEDAYRVDYSKTEESEETKREIISNIFEQDGIRVISQNEFVDNDHDETWEAVGLTFFKDGIIADENNEELKDPEKFVGLVDDIDHFFLMNDSDVMYIRNNRLKIDYEICYDNRCYSDVRKTMPSPVEREEEE